MPDLPGSHCLDLFAGSGALGFEALSRGADRVTMIEKNRDISNALQQNKKLLGADGLSILNQDTLEAIAKLDPDDTFDIVFCDPPFNQELMEPLIQAINNSTLLSENAKLYIETEKSLTQLQMPANWSLLKEKTAGDVRYRLIGVGERSLLFQVSFVYIKAVVFAHNLIGCLLTRQGRCPVWTLDYHPVCCTLQSYR